MGGGSTHVCCDQVMHGDKRVRIHMRGESEVGAQAQGAPRTLRQSLGARPVVLSHHMHVNRQRESAGRRQRRGGSGGGRGSCAVFVIVRPCSFPQGSHFGERIDKVAHDARHLIIRDPSRDGSLVKVAAAHMNSHMHSQRRARRDCATDRPSGLKPRQRRRASVGGKVAAS